MSTWFSQLSARATGVGKSMCNCFSQSGSVISTQEGILNGSQAGAFQKGTSGLNEGKF